MTVHYVENGWPDKPNAHFVRDLMLMTPEGAIVTRPASQQRAGEERYFSAAAVREMNRLMQIPESQVRLAPVPVIAFTPVG